MHRAGQPVRFLMGNHEEVLLRAAAGDVRALRFLVRIGGKETLMSYGLTDEEYRTLDYDELSAVVSARIPQDHVDFLGAFESWIEVGDYLFVHAGLRPGIASRTRRPATCAGSATISLNHRDSFGHMVVHGHSITEDVDLKSNRIGIDTGAFASHRLTAIGLEKDERWFLST
jgi:serine/threonine protein phosphatase 1